MVKAGDEDPSVAVVVEVMPPEKNVGAYGQTIDGEAIKVAFPSALDRGPVDWRDIDPALLASYCDDQDIKLYTYRHDNLEFAENPYAAGDRVINTRHDDPNTAVVVTCENGTESGNVSVAFLDDFEDEDVWPGKLEAHCEENGIECYTYEHTILEFTE